MEGFVFLTYLIILSAANSHGGISDHCCTHSECAFLVNGFCKPSVVHVAGPDMCKRRKREALDTFREGPEGGLTLTTPFWTITPRTREPMGTGEPFERMRKGTCECKPGYNLFGDVCADGANKTHATDGSMYNKTICYMLTCTGPQLGCTLDTVSNEREQPEGSIEKCVLQSQSQHCITIATRSSDSVTETTGCAEDCREETSPTRTVSCCQGNYCNVNNTSLFVDSSASPRYCPMAYLLTGILVVTEFIILII